MRHLRTLWRLALCGWLATHLLVAAADNWQHYDTDNTAGLAGNEIQFVGSGKDGSVWIGTLSGISRYHDGAFTRLQDEAGKPLELAVWTVVELAENTLCIGHSRGVLMIRDGKHEQSLQGFTVAPIVEVAPGELWAIGKDQRTEANQLFRYQGKGWEPHPAAGKFRIVDLFRRDNGELWMTLDGNGVLQIDPEKGIEEAVHHLQGLNVTTIAEDGRRIWCGLWDRGVAAYDGVAWEEHLKREIKGSAVLSIHRDANGNMWVATSAQGVFQSPFNKQTWDNFLAEEGAINLVAPSSDGRIWISSQMVGGLRVWDGNGWKVSLDIPLPIRCFHETEKALWAGGVLDGIYRLEK